MKNGISKEVILKSRCSKNNHPCLNGDLDNCCKIINCVDGRIHYVKPVAPCICNNMINFGDSCFCCCPTRKEIYNKFGK